MAMPDLARRYTVAEVLKFPQDGNRYEVLDGELLVSPAPSLPHQRIVWELAWTLGYYLDPLGLRRSLYCLAADISWNKHNLVQPDLFLVSPDEPIRSWRDCRNLLLAVEVLSPRSGRADRVLKRKLYQRYRVQTYWIVDPKHAQVEVWLPGDREAAIVTDTLRWRPNGSAPEIAIDLPKLFRSIAG